MRAEDRPRRTAALLVAATLVVVAVGAALAVIADDGGAAVQVVSLRGERVELYGGAGPYALDTTDKALMQRAFDVSYLAWAVPLALAALVGCLRGRAIGLVVLASSLAYFWYASAISALGNSFNRFFLVYVCAAVLSGWATVRVLGHLDEDGLRRLVLPRVPARTVGVFVLALAAYFVVTWLAVDVPLLFSGGPHPDLGVYTTAETNVLDLAVYAPASIWAGIGALRGRARGTLVSVVIVAMASQMLVSLTVYTWIDAAHRGAGPAGVEWPLPIAAAACLAVSGWVLVRLRGVAAQRGSGPGRAGQLSEAGATVAP